MESITIAASCEDECDPIWRVDLCRRIFRTEEPTVGQLHAALEGALAVYEAV